MRPVKSWCALGMMLALWVPHGASAAGNPVIDVLAQGAVVQWSGTEAISQPFVFDVSLSTKEGLNLAQAVGQPIALTVAPGRVISGMIEQAEHVEALGGQGLYRLHIVPSVSRLAYRSGSRMFSQMNATDIAMQLLKEAGIPFEVRVAAGVPSEELTIQYQETDLSFASRVLEAAGIHYHVEATSAGDKFVLGDNNGAFPPAAVGKLVFSPAGNPAVIAFSRGQALHSGQVHTGDYNWKTPTATVSAVSQAGQFVDLAERVYPAGVENQAEAQAKANLRLAVRMAESQGCRGESTYPQLQAGTRVNLVESRFSGEYLITSVTHQYNGKVYRNEFRCVPAQVIYRPLPRTPIPTVAGVVSGIVVGPQGEPKHVDQYARVKVRFPWLPSQPVPGDAGFVRVAQIAAGSGSAALWLPEVGDEVLVAFEHGDLRHPVIVGSVYNAKDMPPVALPANQHVSLFRHRGANGVLTEVVLDGAPGAERLFLQGQSVAVTSGGDLLERAGRTMVLESASDLAIKSGQSLAVLAQKDAAVTIAGNTQWTIGGDAQWTVGKSLQQTVGVNHVMDIGKDLSIRAGQNYLLQVQRLVRLTAADDAVLQVGKSLVVNTGAMFQFVAAQTGTLQVGGSFIGMKRDGDIDIIGKDIDAKASGNLTMKGSKILQN